MSRALRIGTLLVALSLAGLAADLTLTMRGGGGANESAQTQLWSSRFMRTNNPGTRTDTLVDYEKGVIYNIDHKKKTVEFFSWDDLEAMAEGLARQMKDMPPQVLAMMGGGGGEVKVENAGKVVVAGRNCQRWIITAGKMVFESSHDASLRPPIPAVSFTRFLKVQNLQRAMGPAAGQMKQVGEEMAKIQGMALKTRTVMPMVGEIVTEATEVKEGPIPTTAFDLPAGYKTVDKGKELAKNYKQ